MSSTRTPQIRFAAQDAQFYIAFEGSATHHSSVAAEHLAAEFLAQEPQDPQAVLDLQRCDFVDSTFAGWMLRLRQRLKQTGGRVIISRCPDACRANLDLMGLTSLFDFESVPMPAKTKEIACPNPDQHDAEWIAVMLHAHEDLADVNSDNKEAFTPVIDTLRDELRKR